MTADYTTMLGCSLDDEPLGPLVRQWPAFDYIDDEDLATSRTQGRLSLFDSDHGLYLFFTDDRSYVERFGFAKTQGKLILARVTLFGDFHPDFACYSGPMPGGLSMTARFDAWEGQFGEPIDVQRINDVVRKARWKVDERFVDVSFQPAGQVRMVSFTPMLSELAIEARGEAARRHRALPAPDQLARLFGTPLAELAEMPALKTLELDQRTGEASSYGEIDFSREDGFEMYVRPGDKLDPVLLKGPDPSAIRLSSVRYRCDLDFKSQPWLGALPMGLEFDDCVETVVAKVGRPPDEQHFRVMDGSQSWYFTTLELHVLHSLAEDHVQRVTLRAHGRPEN